MLKIAHTHHHNLRLKKISCKHDLVYEYGEINLMAVKNVSTFNCLDENIF